jgi:hypothetical protein
MFQIAAAIGYAKKYGYAWAAPTDGRESSIHQVFPNLPKTRNMANAFPRRDGYDPQFFDYFDIPNVGPDVLLAGYFQSKKFFAHCEEEVKKVFQLDINPIDAVSIHVRRGDYVTYANSFPPVDFYYVDLALREIESKGININKVIIFSDDPTYCREQIYLYNKFHLGENPLKSRFQIDISEGRTEREDLSLMASCKHHIIANSSFSWWGAYLGHNPDKIIVSPHRESWYGPDNGVVKWYKEHNKTILPDLIPEEWIQIKFR